MHAHHARKHIGIVRLGVTDKRLVFQHRFLRLVLSVPVRHLITQTCPDAQLFRHIRNGKQAVFDLSEAGMMVKNSSHTVTDTGNHRIHRTVTDLLQCQMSVNVPPLAVQNIQKPLRIVALNAKAPCHGAVNMLMGIDKSRHNHTAFCIYVFCIRI